MAEIISSITAVFSAIWDWIISSIPDVIAVFYTSGADGGLTFLGVLSLCALGISIFFLVLGLIQNFLHFRS